MLGECMWKMRSTPTPYEILRTVKLAPVRPPRFRMTTPLQTWMRCLSPSTMRTCTSTVSPGRNAGRSPRICSRANWSTRSISSPILRLANRQGFYEFPVFLAEVGLGQQIRPPRHRPGHGLLAPPPGNALVVALQQHLGNLVCFENPGAGVMGVFQEALLERLFLGGPLSPQNPG